jgi:hypothetical protein
LFNGGIFISKTKPSQCCNTHMIENS